MTIPKYFVWRYRSVVEVGSGCRTFIPQRFSQMGSKRVGMITDPGLVDAGVADMVADIFKVQGGPQLVGIYDKIEPDAVMRVINDCAAWYRANALDGMLVVGGGSVMDSAKGVKMLIGMNETEMKKLMPGNLGPYIDILGAPLNVPSVFVPTTAGTGSEVSPLAVIYNEEAKVKGDVVHEYIMGEYAMLDPDLTVGLPAGLTAATGFDALGHAIEGLSSPETNCMSDSLNLQAIKLIVKYLPIAVNEPKNLEARIKMLVASNMAIMGFANGGMIYPVHNLAHACGAQLRIPHGQAVGVGLAAMLDKLSWHYYNCAPELADALGVKTSSQDPAELVNLCREKILALMKEVGFVPKFEQELNDEMRELMYWAVKLDPSGMLYPIPDDIIRELIGTCFAAA